MQDDEPEITVRGSTMRGVKKHYFYGALWKLQPVTWRRPLSIYRYFPPRDSRFYSCCRINTEGREKSKLTSLNLLIILFIHKVVNKEDKARVHSGLLETRCLYCMFFFSRSGVVMEFTVFQSVLRASRPRRLKARDWNTIWQNKSTTTSISSCFDHLPRSSLADAELRFQSRINFLKNLLRQHGQDVKRRYNQCIFYFIFIIMYEMSMWKGSLVVNLQRIITQIFTALVFREQAL